MLSPDQVAYLASNGMNNSREVVVLGAPMLHPRCEPAQLAIVTVIGEPHLWADEENLAAVNDYTTVIYDILVHDGPVSLDEWTSKK